MKRITKIKEKILDALEGEREFELVFTTESTYSVKVYAKNKEEAERMFEEGELDWDWQDMTDENYLDGSLEVYEEGER